MSHKGKAWREEKLLVIRLVDGKKFKFRVMLYSVDKTENLRPGHSISRDAERL